MINQVVSKIIDEVDFNNPSQTTSYLNMYNYKRLRNLPEIYNSIDYFTLDGIMMILFLRLFYGKKFERKAPDFSSYFIEMFADIASHNRTICFVGGSEKDIIQFVKIVKENYPDLRISHAISGYDLEEDSVIDQFISEQVDVVVVGLGTPKQEKFMFRLRNKGYKGAVFSCGAFISQTASKGREYFPNVVNKFHIRWIYRIYKEPKLFKRYFISYPRALFQLLRDYRTNKNTTISY